MQYIGIDLAWGERNGTAVAALSGTGDPRDGATLVAVEEALLSDEEILAFVAAQDNADQREAQEKGVAPGIVVGIDAPTIVPNATGRRPCEAILSQCMRRQEAGPHPANRTLLAGPDGRPRGERIAAGLKALEIPENPYLETLSSPLRACFESFPHPAHIALFGLEKTLKYKAKPKRNLESRQEEFRRYARLLEGLAEADPPLRFPADDPQAWWRRDPATLKPGPLKRHEDALDALTCAYVTLYRHRWGDERSAVIGDLTDGYIVTPATEAMKACFDAAAKARRALTL